MPQKSQHINSATIQWCVQWNPSNPVILLRTIDKSILFISVYGQSYIHSVSLPKSYRLILLFVHFFSTEQIKLHFSQEFRISQKKKKKKQHKTKQNVIISIQLYIFIITRLISSSAKCHRQKFFRYINYYTENNKLNRIPVNN